MARDSDMRRFHGQYKALQNKGVCVYCGIPATSQDHFVPISVAAMMAFVSRDRSARFLVPCCRECNSTAGNKIFRTIGRKRRHIQECYRRKYRRTLALPDWSEDEFEEISWTLQRTIINGIMLRNWLRARIGWRNSDNHAAAQLAEIRFNPAVFGRGSARRGAA